MTTYVEIHQVARIELEARTHFLGQDSHWGMFHMQKLMLLDAAGNGLAEIHLFTEDPHCLLPLGKRELCFPESTLAEVA